MHTSEKNGQGGLPIVVAIVVADSSPASLMSSLRSFQSACAGVAEPRAVVVGDSGNVAGTSFGAWTQSVSDSDAQTLGARFNRGLSVAITQHDLPDWVCFLSAGLLLDPGAICEALGVFASDDGVGVVAGTIRAEAGQPFVSAFRFPSTDLRAGGLTPLGFIEREAELPAQGQPPVHVDFVPALACLVRRKVLDRIGGFDPRMGPPYDAADFFARMRTAGFTCRFLPSPFARGTLPSFCLDQSAALDGRQVYLAKHLGNIRAAAADLGWIAARTASLLTGQGGDSSLPLATFLRASVRGTGRHFTSTAATLAPDRSRSVEEAVGTPRVGLVAIGRNEGERLRRCLESAKAQVQRLVYVDSGSKDGSVALAKEMGAEVVELDLRTRFTAARARNAGAERLLELDPRIDFIHFVDGDCEISPGWVSQALDFAQQHPAAAVIAGRRRERYPEASVYNRLCDREWNTPVRQAEAVGGDALVKVAAFREVKGYDPTLIAGEEPEMCARLRLRGWEIWRIDGDMTVHDAAMFKAKQWWQRTRRSGYAYAEVSHRYRVGPMRVWARESRSICIWGNPFAWPAWPLLYWRIYRRDRDMAYALSTTVGKLPQLLGLLEFHINRIRGKQRSLIEYK